MFTPKNIQMALEDLFDLYDPDEMVGMLENYGEEFDDIDPELLAQAFQRSADMVYDYRVLSSAGDGFDYCGQGLLDNRAVKLLTYGKDKTGDDRVHTIQSMELWLEEDMTFSVVSCVTTVVMENNEAICATEYRTFVKAMECEDDIFFDMADLVCELDDVCMFELLIGADATICEP